MPLLRLLLALLLPALPVAVKAQFNYATVNGTITVTEYTGSGGAVTIPGTINGLPVTGIGYDAFGSCTGLTVVSIGSSVTNIGDHAFYNCPSLTALAVAALNSAYSSVDGVLFDKSRTTLIQCPAGKTGSYAILNGVTRLGDSAFYGCARLSGVTIPNGVTSIGESAFANCTSLAGVTIPDSVTNIGDSAFYGCSRLVSVTIPGGVGNIGDGAFEWCFRLTAITVDPLNSAYGSLDGVLFDKSHATLVAYPEGKAGTSYTVPNTVTRIGDQAFWYCASLTNVTIGYGVTNIGSGAFANCPSLASLYFEGNAPSAGSDVFYGDNNRLTVYYLPWNTGWGTTFGGLPAMLGTLTTPPGYTISNGALTITRYTGAGGAVTLPGTAAGLPVTSIGELAFYDCAGVTSITVPNSVTSIGTWAFESCSNLASVTIPNSVTNIGEGTFSGCARLASITIPSSVTSIGSWTFQSCTGLASLYFEGNAPSFGSDVFAGDNNRITVYYMPGTTGWGTTFDGLPTMLWNAQGQAAIGGFGLRANQFGFNITGSSNLVVVVQASTNLANPAWYPLQTNTLNGASLYFSDPQWTNYASRFYRLAAP